MIPGLRLPAAVVNWRVQQRETMDFLLSLKPGRDTHVSLWYLEVLSQPCSIEVELSKAPDIGLMM